MAFEALEEKRVYRRAEELGDMVWEVVAPWEWFAKRSVGLQWTRSTDSIGANIAEAGGRYHPADVKNFLYHARGSLRETKFWLRRAHKRNLIDEVTFQKLNSEIELLSKEINGSINHQKARIKKTA